MDARSLFETFFRRAYRDRDPSAVDEFRAPSAATTGLADAAVTTNDAFRAFHSTVLAAFPRAEVIIDELMEKDGVVLLWLRFCGTTSAGREVEVRGAARAQIAGGRIVAAENLWNVAGVLAQGEPALAPRATDLSSAARLLAGR